MEARGGGLKNIELIDCTHLEPEYYQLKATFETCDMGANFINSVLEEFAAPWKKRQRCIRNSAVPREDRSGHEHPE